MSIQTGPEARQSAAGKRFERYAVASRARFNRTVPRLRPCPGHSANIGPEFVCVSQRGLARTQSTYRPWTAALRRTLPQVLPDQLLGPIG